MEPTQLSPDQKIWRYMDLPKFGSLLCYPPAQAGSSGGALWFARADTFEDKWEGFSRVVPTYPGRVSPQDEPAWFDYIRKHVEWRRGLRKRSFISCWTAWDTELIPMWKSYAPYDSGIVIQSTVQGFERSVPFPREYPSHTHKTGAVRYYEDLAPAFDYRTNIEYSLNIEFETLLQKRLCFEFEREWRAIIVNPIKRKKGLQIPVDVNGLVERVLVSPLAPKSFLHTVVTIARQFGLKAKPECSELARGRPKHRAIISAK